MPDKNDFFDELEFDAASQPKRSDVPNVTSTVTEAQQGEAEKQVVDNERIVDYDTKEYPVETIVDKYLKGKEDEENELFVPDYQRDFTWSQERQSKFIESVLIGL